MDEDIKFHMKVDKAAKIRVDKLVAVILADS